MKTIKVKLGKGRIKCKLPNGIVIVEGKGNTEVEYTPFISRSIRFGDLEEVVKAVVKSKKKTASNSSNKTTGEE